jgi:hypothetical protein
LNWKDVSLSSRPSPEVVFGRPKTLGQCKERGCARVAVKRQRCQLHYDNRYYKNKNLRFRGKGAAHFKATAGGA